MRAVMQARKSRCFGLPHPVSAALSCVRSGCIAAPRSDAAAACIHEAVPAPYIGGRGGALAGLLPSLPPFFPGLSRAGPCVSFSEYKQV